MYQIKHSFKKLLPTNVRQPIANTYHLGVAILANLRYGFPARSAQVIMITGTNGKTTTAAFVARMLMEAGYKVGVNTTAFYSFGDGQLEPNISNRTVSDVMQ